MLNGLRVIRNLQEKDGDIYVIGIPIVLTFALVLIPTTVVKEAPQMVQYLLGSPIAVAAMVAIILNLVMSTGKNK